MKPYWEVQRQFLLDDGQSESAATLLERWSSLVEECKDGYQWDISELSEELRARDTLGRLSDAPQLLGYQEHLEFLQTLERIDEGFKRLLLPEPLPSAAPWWRAGVLSYAGQLYADYMKKVYNVVVSSQPAS